LRERTVTVRHGSQRAEEELKADLERPGADASKQREILQAAFASASARYPRYRELLGYRWRVTKFIIGLLLMQELVFLFASRVVAGRWLLIGSFASVLFWLGLGAWLHFFYLHA
jgi:hypothetical protein